MPEIEQSGKEGLTPWLPSPIQAKLLQSALIKKELLTEQPAKPLFPAWKSFSSICYIKNLAAKDNMLWIATNGGVVSWQIQDNVIQYTRYGSEHGLPGNLSSHITLDNEGDVWVGHHGFGVSRFHDKQWYNIPLPDGTSGAKIKALVAGHDGKLWIGTSQGVGYLEKEVWYFPQSLQTGLPGGEVQDLAIDRQGDLWLGTLWGLYHFQFQTESLKRFTVADNLPSNGILSLACGISGNLWVGTSRGLCLIERDQILPIPGLNAPILDVSLDDEERVWICTPDKITYWHNEKWINLADIFTQLNSYPTTRTVATSVAAAEQGQGWGGFSTGLVQYTPLSRPRIIVTSDGENKLPTCINALVVDITNNLWVGTDQGLFYLDEDKWQLCQPGIELDPKFPQLEAVKAIAVSSERNEVWVGSWQKRGVRLLRNFGEFPIQDSPYVTFIETLTCTSQGNIWLANQKYLCQYTNRSWGEPIEIPVEIGITPVRSIATIDNRVVWCGTVKGLYKYANEKWSLRPLLKAEILSLSFDKEGYLWVGTDVGLYNVINGKVTLHLTAKDGLPANSIRAIVVTQENILWVGTDGGLARVTQGQVDKFWLANSSGLVDNRIRALALTRQGKLWIGTANGISYFDPILEEVAISDD
jgi:ligand-binding sensor domain-containing protein